MLLHPSSDASLYHWRTRLYALILSALLVWCVLGAGKAYAAPPNRPTIRVGYLPGYGITTSGGDQNFSGYSYEYLMEISKYTGWDYTFVPCGWSEGLEMLERGELDLFGPMQKSGARSGLFDFPNLHMGYEYGALFVSSKRESIYYNDYSAFDGMVIGTERDNLYIPELDRFSAEHGFSVRYKFASMDEFEPGLANGTFDAVLSGSMTDIADTVVVGKVASLPFYFATTKGNLQVLRPLNDALQTILREDAYFPARLDKKYYGGSPSNIPVFTRDEANFIENCPVLTVACNADWSPILYQEASGEIVGIAADMLHELEKSSGLRFELVPADSYNHLREQIANQSAQLALGTSTGSMPPGMLFSQPLLNVPVTLIGSENLALDGPVPVAVPGSNLETARLLALSYPNFIYTPLNPKTDPLLWLARNPDGLIMVNSYTFDDLVRTGQLHDYTAIATNLSLPVSLALPGSSDPLLREVLNKSIQRLSTERINAIIFSNTVNRSYQVSLSALIRSNAPALITILIFISALLISTIVYFSRRTQAVLRRIAYTDELTHLPTVTRFTQDATDRLQSALPGQYMLVCMDVDNFKYINDSLGYDNGNLVLVLLARQFSSRLNKQALLCRGAADNFLLFAPTLRESSLADWFDNLTRLDNELEGLFPSHYSLVFTAGVYVIEDPAELFTRITDKANIARKLIKGSHTNTLQLYTATMDAEMQWKRQVTISMEHALHAGEFVTYFQPQFSMNDQRPIGAEALVRWQHPELGLVMPDQFIPLFERNGFIRQLDFFVFEQACRLLHSWDHFYEGEIPMRLAVNLSRLNLNNKRLGQDLLDICNRYQVRPGWIEIELTESAVAANHTALVTLMRSLREMGFLVAMDDFGSGYSSLGLLRDLPVDVLKIDKSFLGSSMGDGNGRQIIAMVLELSKALGIQTIAEGVETAEQATQLRNMGCTIAQGFYYARPMTAWALCALVARYQGKDAPDPSNDCLCPRQ